MSTYSYIVSTVIFLAIVVIIIIYPSPRREYTTNTARGNAIIEAIRKYEQANQKEPQALDQLIPAYIPEIPQTLLAGGFLYQSYDPFTYNKWSLTFYITGNNTGCTYISHFDFWDCWPPNAGKH